MGDPVPGGLNVPFDGHHMPCGGIWETVLPSLLVPWRNLLLKILTLLGIEPESATGKTVTVLQGT